MRPRLFRRLLCTAAILYFAIAAYGRYHKPEPEYVCPCNECDCGSLDELKKYEGATP